MKKEIHEYMCDNFNVPKVINSIIQFIKLINNYMKDNKNCKFVVLNSVKKYISHILYCLGIEYENNNS